MTKTETLLRLMAGNHDAVKMVQDIAFASHIYDDLIDKDKMPTDEQIHSLMWTVLVVLPINPFYRQYESMLRPIIVTGILNWRAANDMEASGSTEELRIAHALRYSIADIAMMAMVLAGGQEHATKHARELRLFNQQDTWANYAKEHKHAEI